MAALSLVLTPQTVDDLAAIERLDEHAFGPGRFARSAYRLREGVEPDYSLSFVARVGTLLVGANRITAIRCGEAPALLLGPLTVDPAFRSGGIGEALVQKSLDAARAAGHALVLLVGDLPYYEKMGFRRVPPGKITFIGPVDPERLLYCELVEGALDSAGAKVRRVRAR
ncbi:GCN5-related N-acetyltransferase [Methylocella silvestris BL2]|uniref:GCN5-related N-acetyltransferase n=1 Tax=Methylocella silvestris (strain DSM 15510 / CIP 108128 / LMG 27833 / NCIMB 13906 / BL2) TaxID=395965 RepID=B8ET65_METSB|nr:N-acetyltransferase [Methylocella silvestris]ACK51203.1 GCN5-related N-acetyltransferase [Methylocella silvestris BL2]